MPVLDEHDHGEHMSTDIRITWRGLEELRAKFTDPSGKLQRALELAGKEAGEDVLNQDGLRRYPPAGTGNQPPVPFYVRGRGTQYRSRNTNQSERYGSRFYVNAAGGQTYVGNTASYAPYLVDEVKQSRVMAQIGWRKLGDVIRDRMPTILQTYAAHIRRLFND